MWVHVSAITCHSLAGLYIVVKGRISVKGTNNANRKNKKLTIKENGPFTLCISKINNTFMGFADNLDLVMLIYMLEYSDNYSDIKKFVGLL